MFRQIQHVEDPLRTIVGVISKNVVYSKNLFSLVSNELNYAYITKEAIEHIGLNI
jgi:hypothetical protein